MGLPIRYPMEVVKDMNQHPSPPLPPWRACVRRALQYGGIAMVLLAAILFIARRDIGNRLARKLEERLATEGIFVSWRSADWTWGSGISFHGLTLYRDRAKQDRLAILDTITVSKGNPEWNR